MLSRPDVSVSDDQVSLNDAVYVGISVPDDSIPLDSTPDPESYVAVDYY